MFGTLWATKKALDKWKELKEKKGGVLGSIAGEWGSNPKLAAKEAMPLDVPDEVARQQEMVQSRPQQNKGGVFDFLGAIPKAIGEVRADIKTPGWRDELSLQQAQTANIQDEMKFRGIQAKGLSLENQIKATNQLWQAANMITDDKAKAEFIAPELSKILGKQVTSGDVMPIISSKQLAEQEQTKGYLEQAGKAGQNAPIPLQLDIQNRFGIKRPETSIQSKLPNWASALSGNVQSVLAEPNTIPISDPRTMWPSNVTAEDKARIDLIRAQTDYYKSGKPGFGDIGAGQVVSSMTGKPATAGEIYAQKEQDKIRLAKERGLGFAEGRSQYTFTDVVNTDTGEMQKMSNNDFAQMQQDNPGLWIDAAKSPEYGAKRALEKAFVSGPTSINIRSLNTVAKHMSTLSDAIDALNTGDIKRANQLTLAYGSETGFGAIGSFDAAKSAVANELATALKSSSGSAAGTDIGLQQELENLNKISSPKILKAALKTYAEIIEARLVQTNESYRVGAGKDFPVLRGEAKQALEKLLGRKTKISDATSGQQNQTDAQKRQILKDRGYTEQEIDALLLGR